MKNVNRLIAIMLMACGLLFVACGKDDNHNGGTTRHTLTVLANNADWGTAVGGGTYNSGDRVDIEAVPAEGYYFIRWSDGAVSNPRTVTVSSNITIYALFSATENDPNPYNPADGPIEEPEPDPTPQPTTGEWIDLGLPSGLLWASHNVGAETPEEYGNYYAWGETTTKSTYDFDTYAHGSYNSLTKYCTVSDMGSDDFADNLTILEPTDDAATANVGNGARTPTKSDWQELLDNTTVEQTTVNGVNGNIFTATNGNSIFLPAAGYRSRGELEEAGFRGNYWSSSLNEDDPNHAFSLCGESMGSGGEYRAFGFSVRPVRAQ